MRALCQITTGDKGSRPRVCLCVKILCAMAYVVWRVVLKKYAKVRLGLTHRGTEPVSVVLLQSKAKVVLLVKIEIS